MTTPALERSTSRLTRGRVLMIEGHRAVVDDGCQRFVADRAASCLVAAEPGDLVLCDRADAGASYLLAVLERSGATTRICVEGDATIEVGGRLGMRAAEGLDIATAGDASLTAGVLRATAGEASMVARVLALAATAVRTEAGSVKTVADEVDVIAGRLWSRVKRAYRFVEERDQVRAGSIDHRAEQTVSVRGRNAMMIAEELVKLDGGQIHVG
jgi:hypothetical protein